MTSEEMVFTIEITDPVDAAVMLEKKRFEYECVLNYVSRRHPEILTPAVLHHLDHCVPEMVTRGLEQA